ncbi:MAG: AI-2E family transporter, partial [Anaerolineaceae bacterium]
MQTPSRPRWATHTKVIVILLILAAAVYLLVRFKSVLPPVILAVILAYILYPLVNRIQSALRLPRALAVLLAYLLVGAVIAGLLTVIIPYLVNQVTASQWNFSGILNRIAALLGR